MKQGDVTVHDSIIRPQLVQILNIVVGSLLPQLVGEPLFLPSLNNFKHRIATHLEFATAILIYFILSSGTAGANCQQDRVSIKIQEQELTPNAGSILW